jgi:integrase
MPIRRDPRTGNWFFRSSVRCPDGTRRRVFGTPGVQGQYHDLANTKIGAQEAERRAIAAVLRGEERKPQPAEPKEVMTLAEFATRHFLPKSRLENKHSSVVSKETILNRHVLPRFGPLPLDRIDYGALEDLKSALASPPKGKRALQGKSINNVLTVVRSLLADAYKRKLIKEMPQVEWLRYPPGRFDFLTFEEASQLVAATDGEWTTMILVALRTGLRHGELLALRWEDVDVVAGRITVRQAVGYGVVGTPKSGRSREVALSPETVRALTVHKHDRGQIVFCRESGRMLRKNECKHPLWRACQRAKLRRIGWHALRHTFASHLVMRGVPLKAVQELLGHADIRMTMRYSHLAPEVKRDAVALLDGDPASRGSHVAAEAQSLS